MKTIDLRTARKATIILPVWMAIENDIPCDREHPNHEGTENTEIYGVIEKETKRGIKFSNFHIREVWLPKSQIKILPLDAGESELPDNY